MMLQPGKRSSEHSYLLHLLLQRHLVAGADFVSAGSLRTAQLFVARAGHVLVWLQGKNSGPTVLQPCTYSALDTTSSSFT